MTVGGFGSDPDPARGRIEFTDQAGDEPAEEVLATGRPTPRWVRAAALAGAVLVGGYVAWYAIGHVGGGGGTQPVAHATGPQIAPPLFVQPGGMPMHRSSDIACDTGLPPWVRPLRPAVHTGLHLLVGGTTVGRVAFDTGHSTRVPVPSLRSDEWVSALSGPPAARLATTSSRSCGLMSARVLPLQRGSTVATDGSSGVVADETRLWVVHAPPPALHPVTGGHDTALPLGFAPVAATDGFIAGDLTDAMDSGELGVVDTRTGLLHGIRGRGVVLAAGAGRLFWTQGCDTRTARPCLLHSAPLHGGSARTYRLPSSPGDALGRVDPTGRRLAFTLARQDADGDGDGDASVVVLDLAGGRLTTLPGIEVTTRYQPQYAFAPSGHWLVLSFARSGRAQLAAWRPGLHDPVRSVARPASPAAPPVVVLSG